MYTRMLSHFSHVRLFATPRTVAHQAPLSMGFFKLHSPGLSSQPRNRTQVSFIVGRFFTVWVTREALLRSSVQFSSVAQSCPTLCDPMNRSTPGLPVHHQLLEFRLTSIELVMPSSHLILCRPPFSSCPQSLPASESFPMSQLFAWGGQSTRVSALASVPPKNTHDWSPLGWTGWISLQSKGLSRVFSKRLFYTSVSLLLSRTPGYYHLSKFNIYALVYCIGVFLSGLLHSV